MGEPNIKSFRRVLLDVRVQRKRPRWPVFLSLDGLGVVFPLLHHALVMLFGIKADVG